MIVPSETPKIRKSTRKKQHNPSIVVRGWIPITS